MFKRLLVILMLLPFLLVACSQAQPDTIEDNASLEMEAPSMAATAKSEPTESEAIETEPTATASSPKIAGLEMECTLISNLPEAPAELIEIFGVNEDDWAKGPETAAVTIVEYSDFQ